MAKIRTSKKKTIEAGKPLLKIGLIEYWPRVYKISLECLVIQNARKLSKTISLMSKDSGANVMKIILSKDEAIWISIRIVTAKDLKYITF